MIDKYTKSNLMCIFYATGTTSNPVWKYFGWGQSHGLSVTSQTNEITSKMHGLHPDKEISSISFEMSQTVYASISNLNTALEMANSAAPITWAFAKVSNPDTVAADGLKTVTNYGNETDFTFSGSDFVQYGAGIVTSASVSSEVGSVASIDMTISGMGALSSTAPTGDLLHVFNASNPGTINASTGD